MQSSYRYISDEHIHILDDHPLCGTSTIIGTTLSKPLSYWASGLAVQTLGVPDYHILGDIQRGKAPEEAVNLYRSSAEIMRDRIGKMNTDEYMNLLDAAYRAHAKSLRVSSADGTDLHAELSRFLQGEIAGQPAKDIPEQIMPFVKWSREFIEKWLFSEAHCYSRNLWVGGIADAAGIVKPCGRLPQGGVVIFDFKSAKSTYFDHYIQVAGYACQIAENGIFNKNGDALEYEQPTFAGLAIVPFGNPDTTPRIR